jgi:putative Holliday junction resolvase
MLSTATLRTIGLDVGTKTIGVAVSDELGLAAHPRRTLARLGDAKDVAAIAAVVAEEGAERVVVGLPLTLAGEIGPMAKRVLALCAALEKHLTVPVETWDERFSTAGATRALLEGDASRARRKQVIDKQAAAFILQGWLDARRSG